MYSEQEVDILNGYCQGVKAVRKDVEYIVAWLEDPESPMPLSREMMTLALKSIVERHSQ